MEATTLTKSASIPFQLSLRIRHPSLDPADISREFSIEAEHSFRAGDPRPSRSGVAPTSVHTESYWLGTLNAADFPPGHRNLPKQLVLHMMQERANLQATRSVSWGLVLVTRFLNAHAEMLRRIRAEGGQVSLLVLMSMGEMSSFSLTPELGRIFSDLGITIEFEFASD